MAPMAAMVRMSSQVALSHCPKLGLVLEDEGVDLDERLGRVLSLWAPDAAAVSAGGVVLRLKRPMVWVVWVVW